VASARRRGIYLVKHQTTGSDIETASARLLRQAHRAAQLRADTNGLDHALAAVKHWQSARLAICHADLLAHPRYGQATQFFMQDLYGAKDFSARDQQLLRIINSLARYLPEAALATIADAVELDALSEQLDQSMARWLLTAGCKPCEEPVEAFRSAHAQAGGLINLNLYRAALVGASSLDERLQQVALVKRIGTALDRLVRKPLLGGLLSAMGPMARAASLGDMHEFLERGFGAFKAMRGAAQFIEVIVAREDNLMRAFWGGGPDEQLLASLSDHQVR
jgi:hypothetical protein